MSHDVPREHTSQPTPSSPTAEPRAVLLVSRREPPRGVLEALLGASPESPLAIDRVDSLADVPAILAEQAHEVVAVGRDVAGRDLERLMQVMTRAEHRPPLVLLPEGGAALTAHPAGVARGTPPRPEAPTRDLVEEVFRHSLETSVTRRALRASEARFAALAAACAQGVIVLDGEGLVRLFNPAAERLLGACAEERLGADAERALPGLLRANGEPFADDAHPLRLARWRTWPCVEATVRVRRPDGSDAVLALRVQRFNGTEPGTGRSLLVLLAEPATDAAPAPPSAAPEPGTTSSASPATTSPGAARGTFARPVGSLAHDLNNLLQTIQGYAELMAAELPSAAPGRAHLDPLREAIERSARLVRGLREVASPAKLTPVPLDVDGFLSGLRPLLEYLLGPSIALDLDLALEPSMLLIDAGALEQSVLNLALNARDAMAQGGRLRLATAEVRLDAMAARALDGGRPGRFVRLTLEDDGCGMDEDTRRHAFEPFFTTKPRERGSGLGLATVRGFAERSGGFVTLETAPGRGTRVELYLPRDGR